MAVRPTAAARAAWFARVAALFAAYDLASPVGPTGPFTRAALARALGGRGRVGGTPLPRELSLALPAAFVATFGAHVARERVARDAAAGAAAAP